MAQQSLRIRNTLVTRFTFIILLILVVGQGILYAWLLLYQKEYLESKLKSEVLLSANEIAEAVRRENTQDAVELLMSSHMNRGLALSIRVTDERGGIRAEKSVDSRQGGADRTEEAISGALSFFFIPRVDSVRVPLNPEAAETGSVEVVYSGQPVNEVMKRFLIVPPILQFITFALVIYAIIAFFKKKVSLPVESINKVLKSITTGDLAVDVPDLGKSEIGSISKGLQFLIENLSLSIDRFNALSNHAAQAMGRLVLTLEHLSNAAGKQTDSINRVIAEIRAANSEQKKTTENTDKLSQASSENVSSLLQMKAAAEEIAASTERLFASTADSYTMVSEMSQTSKGIADNANQVFHAAENTSASVEEISASLNAVRDNTKMSSDLSAEVRKLLSERGTLLVADAVEAMDKIEEEVSRTEKIITRLSEQSSDIAKILAVITDITAKTKVLGLNASILATAAGEQGKAFSVVADEIRALSDLTSSSARDIAAILHGIQAEIHEAVGAIGAGVLKVGEGKSSILRSGEAIGESLVAAQKSAHMAAVVERAAEEQAEGLKQIRKSMENVRSMVGQVAKATEEEKKGADHMLETIGIVKEVAELVKKGTGEQVGGTTLISKNVMLTSDMVSQMHEAAVNQLNVNEGIVQTVEEIKNSGISAMKQMEEVLVSFENLRKEIDVLEQEMKKFKTRSVAPA